MAFKKSDTEYTESTAMDQAMRFLAPRFLSRLELTQKLQRKGVTHELINIVLERLEELDYINDERLAHDVLQFYMAEAKYSVQYIRNKMFQRGLTVGSELGQYNELEPALRLVIRHFLSPTAISEPIWYEEGWPEEDRLNQKKVMNFLKNRGFGLGTIRSICEQVAHYE